MNTYTDGPKTDYVFEIKLYRIKPKLKLKASLGHTLHVIELTMSNGFAK